MQISVEIPTSYTRIFVRIESSNADVKIEFLKEETESIKEKVKAIKEQQLKRVE